MTRKSRAAALFLAAGLIFFTNLSWAQPKIYIDITSPTFRRLPLAIAEFKNLGLGYDAKGLAKKMPEVLSRDLEMSGLFQILDPVLFLEDPRRAGITKEEIDFRDWSAIGAEALVKAGLYIRDEELKVEFRLFDVFRQSQITGVRYTGVVDDWRRMAHRIANEIIARFTGEEGVFDTRIAFVARQGPAREIYIMDYDGFSLRPLTRNGSINVSPSWWGNGDRVLFTSYMRGNPDLYLASLDGASQVRLSGWPGLNLGAQWSAAAKKIALVLTKDGNSEIYTMNQDGTSLVRLTNHWAIDVSPSWSPDGKEIAFVSDRSGSPQIYIMKSDGTGLRRLTFEGRYNASPAWSPRGDKIAFPGMVEGRFNLFTINPDGSGLARLTSGANDDQGPSFSPDGRFIVYSSKKGDKSSLYIVHASGGAPRRIEINVADASRPVWSPRLR